MMTEGGLMENITYDLSDFSFSNIEEARNILSALLDKKSFHQGFRFEDVKLALDEKKNLVFLTNNLFEKLVLLNGKLTLLREEDI